MTEKRKRWPPSPAQRARIRHVALTVAFIFVTAWPLVRFWPDPSVVLVALVYSFLAGYLFRDGDASRNQARFLREMVQKVHDLHETDRIRREALAKAARKGHGPPADPSAN